MRAIFTFWDVSYLEELTLNFYIPEYEQYGWNVLSELTMKEDLNEEALKKAL